MAFKNFLFDLDGTLIDSIPSIVESFQQALLTVYNRKEDNEDTIRGYIGLPLPKAFEPYPEKDRERLAQEYIKSNDAIQRNGVPFFKGVKEALTLLKNNGKKLAIISSKRREAVMYWVNKMNVEDLFEVIIGREDTLKNKPDPEPIVHCLKKMNLKKEESIYIGDSVHDVRASKACGVASAVVDWTYMNKNELKSLQPEFWIYNPNDLLSL